MFKASPRRHSTRSAFDGRAVPADNGGGVELRLFS